MKALLVHVKEYRVKITGLATRPDGIIPEPITENTQTATNCIVAFVCVERHDLMEVGKRLYGEIKKMMNETGERNIVICPFVHLSSQLADSVHALSILDSLTNEFSNDKPTRSHFGSDKEVLLDIFGHPGNVRFREF